MRRRRPLAEILSALTYPLHADDITALFDPRYSSKQPRARVTDVVREGPRTATIRFHPPPGWREHQAGQWVRVGVEIDGVRHWRSYSLSTAPGQDPAITVTDIGRVSGALVRRARRGDILYLDPPQGEFVLPEHPRPLLMVTGGTVTFTRSDKEVAADGATALLEAGEANGVPLPSGCRMGICRTCLTKLDAGRVRDLTTGEVHGEPGDLIRTCVSAAAGDVHLDA